MRGYYDEDGCLDDGDLPSLTPKGSNSITSYNQDTTAVEVKGTKLVTYQKGLKNKTDENGRQFWDQLEDESVDEDPDETAITKNSGRNKANKDNGSRYDDDGPDDEMAARRAIVIRLDNRPFVKSPDADNSIPTDNESHVTDEEVEEETYETSFCGQTLNAIEDMCGSNLNLNGSNPDENRLNNTTGSTSRRSLTSSPPIERKRRSSSSPLSVDGGRSSRKELPLAGELQQENTAIEVEYMEPIRQTTSVGSDTGSGVPSDTKRKNLRLNAIAKKAKEKFRNKKGKTSSTQSVSSVQSNDHPGPPSSQQQEIGSADVDDIATATNKKDFGTDGANVAASADDDDTTTNTRSLPDVAEKVDTDYNSFNATEKRKFIRLINSGVVAASATRQVVEERTKISAPVNEEVEEEAADYGDDLGNAVVSAVLDVDAIAEPTSPSRTVNEPIADISTSSAGAVAFKKSGSVYYDAVRRDVNDSEITEFDIAESSNINGRPTGFKGLEFVAAQRFFGGGKPKGFAALPDSPQKSSQEDKSEQYEYTDNNNARDRSVAINSVQNEKMKDMSSSTSFDSFVRNRAVADAGCDLSAENYQMTPNRELAKMDPTERSPDSANSTIIHAQLASTPTHSVLNNVEATLGDTEDSVSSTVQREAGQDLPTTEDIDHSYISNRLDGQEKQEASPVDIDEDVKDVSFTSIEKDQDPSIGVALSQDVSRIVSEESDSVAHTEEQSQGISFISSEKEGVIPRMDMSVDANVNTTVDMSHQNDAMSVYTTGTSLTGVTGTTAYTQSSRIRRPGVAKTRLAKQKELESSAVKKPQGWHETILAAAQSTNRKWDPENGWVDYEEPEITPTDFDSNKDKIRIDLSKSILSHKERDDDDNMDIVAEPSPRAPIPFPREWEKERDAMMQSKRSNRIPVVVAPMKISRNSESNNTANTVADHYQNIEYKNADGETRSASIVEHYKNIQSEYIDVDINLIASLRPYGNVESENVHGEARSIESGVYYDDIIVVEGDEEASRNVIEVVKQKVSEDDLELFPRIDLNAQRMDNSMIYVQANLNSVEAIPTPDMNRADTSLVSLDPSNMSSRRGNGPVDTDEVDETWDSDEEDRININKSLHNGNSGQMRIVDLAEHHHIDEWKDNSHPAPRLDARSVSTVGNDTSRSTGNSNNHSSSSPSKKIPKLQRSKRDTSPLSFRNHLDVAFPRSQESIQRHENYEVEYTQPTTSTNDDTPDKFTAVSITKASPGSHEAKIVNSSLNESKDTNIVQSRLKEWESRIETSHSIDNGESIEKSRNEGLLPVAAAGWKAFLGKKVQTEKKLTAQSEPISHEHQEVKGQANATQAAREPSTDTMFRFADKNEASALNLSDLSPIQVNDDLSDYDIASSIAYGPTEDQRKSSSFLERLTECAAPIMPSKANVFCGRPDEVVEAESMAEVSQASGNSSEKHRRSMSYGDEKPRSLSSFRGIGDTNKVSTSSVISEDFGAKTAFLDSLAMKAAVSKPKRGSSSSRRYDQSGSSSVVSGATDHSEKWKMFLERKKASDTNPLATRGSSADVSHAAEKYAAEKVEEIMSKMAARSKTTPRYREVRNELNDVGAGGAQMPLLSNIVSSGLHPQEVDGTNSAAEDLAAARVEAMMAALANANLDEAEI